MQRLRLPPDVDATAVIAAVGDGRSAVFGAPEPLTVAYLDTFDWRLHGVGLVLAEELGRDRRLTLLEPGRPPLVVPVSSRPHTAAELPPGHLGEVVGRTIGIRALLEVGATRVERRDGRVEDPDGNLLARLRLERVAPVDGAGAAAAPAMTTLGIDPPGALSPTGAVPLPGSDLEAATAARDRQPGDYSSKLAIALDPEQSADGALRVILRHLLTTLEANVEGAAADLDSEFLHDLRVACRRTRSALGQLRGVLPEDTASPFAAGFKWLGEVTGPLRDLDVFLLELPGYRAMLPPEHAADLDPLEALILRDRSAALRKVVRALRSTRFRRLIDGWRRALDELEPAEGGEGSIPVAELAARRIAKAYRRIVKRGRDLPDDPPAAALHRVRIDAKKLRYLLEFFRGLYPEAEIAERISELKRLQDILGGINDMDVQRRRLETFAGRLHDDPAVGATTLMTLGRLAGVLEEREEGFRRAFHDAFCEFSGKPVRAAYGGLFGGKEPQ